MRRDEQKWQEWRLTLKQSCLLCPAVADIFAFAERWADLMEEKLAAGDKLELAARSTFLQANADDLDALLCGVAIAVLADTWEHGAELPPLIPRLERFFALKEMARMDAEEGLI